MRRQIILSSSSGDSSWETGPKQVAPVFLTRPSDSAIALNRCSIKEFRTSGFGFDFAFVRSGGIASKIITVPVPDELLRSLINSFKIKSILAPYKMRLPKIKV